MTAGDRTEATHAEGPLCPRAADHHRAHGGAAVGRRLHVHGAALQSGDAEAVGRRGAGHRDPDRGLQNLSAGSPTTRSCAASRRTSSASWSTFCRSTSCRRRDRNRSSRWSTRRSRRRSGTAIGRPFWIDTVGRSALFEIRIKLDNAVMRVFAPRSAAYVSNSHIFLGWMVGTSLVLITVAVLFLRNQIRPILRLADAAESFGKGREVPDFRPRGAREVRRAAQAFIEMKRRIERSSGAAHCHARRRVPRSAHHPHALQARARDDRRQLPRSRR